MQASKIASAAVAIVLVAGSACAESFNLICKGQRSQTVDGGPMKGTPTVDAFRIDLASNHWCRADCSAVLSITKIDSNEITLLDGEILKSKDVTATVTLQINRRTGDIREDSESSGVFGHVQSWKAGACTRAPFSGFPSQKF